MNDPPPSYDEIAVEEGIQQGRGEVPRNDDNGAQTKHEINPIPENQPQTWRDYKLHIWLATFAFIIVVAVILGGVLGTQLNQSFVLFLDLSLQPLKIHIMDRGSDKMVDLTTMTKPTL